MTDIQCIREDSDVYPDPVEKRKRDETKESSSSFTSPSASKRAQVDVDASPILIVQVTKQTNIDGPEYKRSFPIVLFRKHEEDGKEADISMDLQTQTIHTSQFRVRKSANYAASVASVKKYILKIFKKQSDIILKKIWDILLPLCVNRDYVKNERWDTPRPDDMTYFVVLDPSTQHLYALKIANIATGEFYNPFTGTHLSRDVDIVWDTYPDGKPFRFFSDATTQWLHYWVAGTYMVELGDSAHLLPLQVYTELNTRRFLFNDVRASRMEDINKLTTKQKTARRVFRGVKLNALNFAYIQKFLNKLSSSSSTSFDLDKQVPFQGKFVKPVSVTRDILVSAEFANVGFNSTLGGIILEFIQLDLNQVLCDLSSFSKRELEFLQDANPDNDLSSIIASEKEVILLPGIYTMKISKISDCLSKPLFCTIVKTLCDVYEQHRVTKYDETNGKSVNYIGNLPYTYHNFVLRGQEYSLTLDINWNTCSLELTVTPESPSDVLNTNLYYHENNRSKIRHSVKCFDISFKDQPPDQFLSWFKTNFKELVSLKPFNFYRALQNCIESPKVDEEVEKVFYVPLNTPANVFMYIESYFKTLRQKNETELLSYLLTRLRAAMHSSGQATLDVFQTSRLRYFLRSNESVDLPYIPIEQTILLGTLNHLGSQEYMNFMNSQH